MMSLRILDLLELSNAIRHRLTSVISRECLVISAIVWQTYLLLFVESRTTYPLRCDTISSSLPLTAPFLPSPSLKINLAL